MAIPGACLPGTRSPICFATTPIAGRRFPASAACVLTQNSSTPATNILGGARAERPWLMSILHHRMWSPQLKNGRSVSDERWRGSGRLEREHRMTIRAMRAAARRILALRTEAKDLETDLATLVQQIAPDLIGLAGVGPISAAQILISWSHPGRFRCEGAFAAFAGAARFRPLPG